MLPMKPAALLTFAAMIGLSLTSLFAVEPPRITVTTLPDRSMRLSWNNADGPYGIEFATSLRQPIHWQSDPSNPTLQGTQASVTIRSSDQARFFRLRKAEAPAALTTVGETSPANGESGVAVTRETIVRFTAPL